jgi:hypothetical protein
VKSTPQNERTSSKGSREKLYCPTSTKIPVSLLCKLEDSARGDVEVAFGSCFSSRIKAAFLKEIKKKQQFFSFLKNRLF